MSEMVERVARALAEQEGYTYDPLPYDRRACAAIGAMREPTEEMRRAFYLLDEAGSPTSCVEGWQAMIDAALK
jgi:hypothetical protein